MYVYSLILQPLSSYYGLGMVLDAGDLTLNKIDPVSAQECFLLKVRRH